MFARVLFIQGLTGLLIGEVLVIIVDRIDFKNSTLKLDLQWESVMKLVFYSQVVKYP